MAVGLYKPGQGYWVRVLTATMIGIVTLAAGAWMFGQMGLVAEKLPRSSWTFKLDQPATGEALPAPGQSVTLLSSAGGTEVGTASVKSVSAQTVEIGDIRRNDGGSDPSDGVTAAKIGSGPTLAIAAKSFQGLRPVDPFLLKGLAAALVLLIGAALAYYFTAMHQRFVDFLIATDGEMKKVHWSTRKDIQNSTLVVIAAAFLLSASLFIVDLGFQWFFKTIGILV